VKELNHALTSFPVESTRFMYPLPAPYTMSPFGRIAGDDDVSPLLLNFHITPPVTPCRHDTDTVIGSSPHTAYAVWKTAGKELTPNA
jgi:hypothetical protein